MLLKEGRRDRIYVDGLLKGISCLKFLQQGMS